MYEVVLALTILPVVLGFGGGAAAVVWVGITIVGALVVRRLSSQSLFEDVEPRMYVRSRGRRVSGRAWPGVRPGS